MDAKHACFIYRSGDGFVRWISQSSWVTRAAPEISFKSSHHRQHISLTQNRWQNLPRITYWTNLICHFREWQLHSSWQIKWLHSKSNQLWRQQVNSGIFDTFQTLTEILRDWKEKLPSPSQCMITYSSFQKSLSITSKPKKDPKLWQDGSMTHLRISQVNQHCPC